MFRGLPSPQDLPNFRSIWTCMGGYSIATLLLPLIPFFPPPPLQPPFWFFSRPVKKRSTLTKHLLLLLLRDERRCRFLPCSLIYDIVRSVLRRRRHRWFIPGLIFSSTLWFHFRRYHFIAATALRPRTYASFVSASLAIRPTSFCRRISSGTRLTVIWDESHI